MPNIQLELARRYLENTGVSLFLTGKAGTGKTTFLREVAARSPKRHVVVAPTGVAAVNAGGVTIHSFFQLPFDPYLPDIKELVTEYQLPESQRSMNKTKLDIIRTLELLIIDEVSMVRADLMDAIDMTLRRVRRSSRPFGGVQLLLIGDVHQLAPMVTETERPFLERVYPSPFFFHSKALQQVPYVTIELTKVYRQQDEAFVELLNRVRENRMDAETLNRLNSRVRGGDQGKENGAITLTTHNYQADAINSRHMEALRGEERMFEAVVKGNFPDGSSPVERSLTLKVGERVMFLKNDSSGRRRYYNGKLGTVTGYTREDDADYVEVIDDDGEVIDVGRETWENVKYTLDPKDNQIKTSVDGTFCQYPLRPAWAVTIHKAQGLTFDRVVVNAADAFAFGQVYVALSRCRTLEGLTLTAPLSPSLAFADRDVERFVSAQPTFEQASEAAPQYEAQYHYEQLSDLFGVDAIAHDMERVDTVYSRLKNIYPQFVERVHVLKGNVDELASVSERFRRQLLNLSPEEQPERVAKGAAYYQEQLTGLLAALSAMLDVEIDNQENAAQLKEAGDVLTDRLRMKLACLKVVGEKGFSVAAVQKAKADYLLKDKGKGEKSKGRGGRTKEKAPKAPKERRLTVAERQAPLVQMLSKWRKERAAEQDIPLFHILQQKTLTAIVEARPRTMAELLEVPGIGKIKAELYGKEILDIVADYLESYGGE